MSKSVQIPKELFDDLCSYFLRPSADADIEADLWDRIRNRLEITLDADIRHDLYDQLQRPPTAEEQEQARLVYLSAVAVPAGLSSSVKPHRLL